MAAVGDLLAPGGPIRDPRRLAALRHLHLLDTPADPAFDRLTRLGALALRAPIVMVNLVDAERQFFKSCLGVPEWLAERREASTTYGLCPYVVAAGGPLFVEDAGADPRFRANPAVAELGIRGYAGVPLAAAQGQIVGTFCVVDSEPRAWTAEERRILADLAAAAMTEVELRAATEQATTLRVAAEAERGRLEVEMAERARAEATLRESEERFRAAFAHAATGLALTDLSGRFLQVNDAFLALTGYGEHELRGLDFVALTHPDDRERNLRDIRRLVAGEIPSFNIEKRYVRKDGRPVWVQNSVALARDAQGRPANIIALAEDISERKRAETELARRANQAALGAAVGAALTQRDSLRAMLQRCAEAVVRCLDAAFARIWTLDAEGRVLVLQASAGMYTHLDGGHGRIPVGAFEVGRIAQERRPHLTNDVAGDARVSDPEWARREGMVGFAGYPLIVEDRLVGVLAMFARRPLADDTLDALASIAQTIAAGIERKRAEGDLAALKDALALQLADMTRLHELATQLSTNLELPAVLQEVLDTVTALQGADMGVLMLYDRQAGDLYTTASVGFTEAYLTAVGRVPPGAGACGTAIAERRPVVIEDVETDPVFAPYREAARLAGYRAVFSTPLLTLGEEIVGTIAAYFRRPHRPTEREAKLVELYARQAAALIDHARLYREAQEAIRIRDEFLAAASHDLKNPLAAIKGTAQLLERNLRRAGTVAPARLREGLAGIGASAAQMAAQMDELLDIARLQSGRALPLERAPTDLVALAREAAATHQQATERHRLRVEAAEEAVVGEWDAARLARVLGNLLTNAVKYSPEGGEIVVAIGRAADGAVLTVRDHGIGIPAADLPHVFEQFHRSANVRGRFKGSGVGLAAARQIVEQHGGTIALASREGVGTTVTARLPLGTGEEGVSPAAG